MITICTLISRKAITDWDEVTKWIGATIEDF
jgi:hypothetical protein